MIARILDWVKHRQHDFVMAAAMALVAWSFFNIGSMQSTDREPITITRNEGAASTAVRTTASQPLDPRVVVSKNSSSQKYHYSWCGSGQRIKEENRVWFETSKAAEAAGYSLAGNCK